jgi:hypothetical protein
VAQLQLTHACAPSALCVLACRVARCWACRLPTRWPSSAEASQSTQQPTAQQQHVWRHGGEQRCMLLLAVLSGTIRGHQWAAAL